MSKYDYNYGEEPEPKKKTAAAPVKKTGGGMNVEIWDILSVVTLLFTGCLVAYFAAVFITPNASYNPLIPKSFKITPSVTPTAVPYTLPATWTPTPSPAVTAPATLFPTFTALPSATPFSLIPPTKTVQPSKTPKAPYTASFEGIKSTIIHPEFSCDWQAIGGTIVDANSADMIGMIINLTGIYDGRMMNELTVSGIAPAYGKSGFEFTLGKTPLSAKGQLFLQLLDQANVPLSTPIAIDVFSDCSQNLTLVRFVKNP
jgi:hypothetical protein